MKFKILFIHLLVIGIVVSSCSTNRDARKKALLMLNNPTSLEDVKSYALGEWKSLSVELRPSEDRAGIGTVNPTYLKRHFNYLPNDKFIGTITMFADNFGEIPLLEFEFKGNLKWGEAHPIALGAYKIDYILDEGFGVKPLNDQAAQMLNAGLTEGMSPFETGVQKDILQKAFPMFHIEEDQIVGDYDLIYFKHGLLFMGAKHVDGTPFDKPERRPYQLQIPLERI